MGDYTQDWHGLYRESWKGSIMDEAFAHPAKMAYGLLRHIFDHGVSVGWFKRGDVISDPFGGIGSTGILGAYNGFRVVLVELEPRFVGLAQQNFDLHHAKWDKLDAPHPIIIQGDSREFAKLVGECGCIVSSPPYAESVTGEHRETETATESRDKRKTPGGSLGQSARHGGYGLTDGQIGALKEGELGAVITSPPFTQAIRLVVASIRRGMVMAQIKWGNVRTKVVAASDIPDNIENTTTDTYWQAVASVYDQCRIALRPGGHMVLVVKAYVKKGKRVDLPGDTIRLCESLGFTLRERIRAWLVEETTHPGLWGDIVERKERKSFFRRLAEAKGSPSIDWEEVLVFAAPEGRP